MTTLAVASVFLDAKHDMAVAMDTLIGGPEPIYSKTPQRLDVPIKALVDRGVATTVQMRAAISPQHAFKVNVPIEIQLYESQ